MQDLCLTTGVERVHYIDTYYSLPFCYWSISIDNTVGQTAKIFFANSLTNGVWANTEKGVDDKAHGTIQDKEREV